MVVADCLGGVYASAVEGVELGGGDGLDKIINCSVRDSLLKEIGREEASEMK